MLDKDRDEEATDTSGVNILFLDVDGVLCTPRSVGFDRECVGQLKRVLAAVRPIRVVLSSSWRLNTLTKDKVDNVLRTECGLQGNYCIICTIFNLMHVCVEGLFGCTPLINSGYNRCEEIARWVNEHRGVISQWVAVDDLDLLHICGG